MFYHGHIKTTAAFMQEGVMMKNNWSLNINSNTIALSKNGQSKSDKAIELFER